MQHPGLVACDDMDFVRDEVNGPRIVERTGVIDKSSAQHGRRRHGPC